MYLNIRKSYDFSPHGSVYVITEKGVINLRDYTSHQLIIDSTKSFTIKQQWIKSKKYFPKDFKNNGDYIIYPSLGKRLAFSILILFSISLCYFLYTKNGWSFILIGLVGIYILTKIIFFPKSYFMLKEVPNNNNAKKND